MPLALICTTPTLQAITGNSIRVAGFATPVRSIQAGRTPLIDRWSNLTTKAAPESKERFPEVQQQVERSAAKLQALLQSVAQSSRIRTSAQGDELIQQAVAEVLPDLDEGFLAIAAAYAQTAKDAGNAELADLIDEVRAEVVRQVTRRLPVELQVLNISTQIADREERHNLLQQAMSGGVENLIPACLPSSLWLAATQSIMDMEDRETAPDRRLLAMLCIVREELAELADRLPEWDEELNVAMDNRCQLLAPAALAFLQRLMTVPDPLQRLYARSAGCDPRVTAELAKWDMLKSCLRKGLLTKAFRQMSIDKDREVKLSQLLLAINAVLASLQAVAPIMDSESGTMLYHGTEEEEVEMGQRRLRLKSIRQEAMEAVSTTAGLSKASERYEDIEEVDPIEDTAQQS